MLILSSGTEIRSIHLSNPLINNLSNKLDLSGLVAEVIGYPAHAGNLITTDIKCVANALMQASRHVQNLENIRVERICFETFRGKPTHVRHEDATNPFRHATLRLPRILLGVAKNSRLEVQTTKW
jgi:hypothetical protein